MFLSDKDGFNLPKTEEKILKFWKENSIFEKSLSQRKGKKRFVFFEGPPYANGRPGIHHVLARAFKDIILRYKTMAGYYVPRRAGWDTHGLPIELEAEKELGIKNKKEIEKIGISVFNQKARESIWRYKEEWEKMTERVGYWIDLKNAYVTYFANYIETLWWIFKKIYQKGFLKKDFKVVAYCPRCETNLASHELGMPGAYKKVFDPSVYVKFKIKEPKFKNTYFLVWTTTPWTLPANILIALNPKLNYSKYKIGKDYLLSFNAPPKINNLIPEEIEKIPGAKLLNLKYIPLYHAKKSPQNIYKTVAADFVSTEEGTGFVHIAPAFGEDDFSLAKKLKIKKFPITIDNEGKVLKPYPGSGKFIKKADSDILNDLKKRNLIYFDAQIEHEYPHCWRCNTPLVYFAQNSWFIETSRLRAKLIKANQKINWIPNYLKEGRFGQWLKEAKDWAISRDRFWGTPLPIWECDSCGKIEVIGSLEELNEKSLSKNRFFLLRHSEAEANVKQLIDSDISKKRKNSLTKKGILEAQKAALKLKNQKIDLIFSSPFLRTKQTAQIIAEVLNKKVVSDKRLAEINTGAFDGGTDKKYQEFFANIQEKFSKTPPGGENLTDLKIRVLNFLKEINQKNRGKKILIVSHEDALWMMESAALALNLENTLKIKRLKTGQFKKVDFKNYPVNETGELDIHRPYVDEIKIKCPGCEKEMKRIKDVADVWFDSGAMPYAQEHYPFENKNLIDQRIEFPADYIAEGIDQTRGWFYTLLAISTLLGFEPAYKNVLSLGLVLDKGGQKMSKSKGNVVDPLATMQKYGIDAVRWYFYTIGPVAEPKKFNEEEIGKILRGFIFILYNSFSFYNLYADKNLSSLPKQKSLLPLDQWIILKLNETIKAATANLEQYEINEAAKVIEEFVFDLSRWYIRRSRRRFQKSQNKKDLKIASQVLRLALYEISKLISPFTPFFSEALFQSLRQKSDKLSVHLTDWPKVNKKIKSERLLEKMAEVRRLASLALAKRAELGIKVRQPLKSLAHKSLILRNEKELLDILKEEVNVREIIFDGKIGEEIKLDAKITAELKEEGIMREIIRLIQELRQKADYKPKDKIKIMLELPNELKDIIQKNENFFIKETGAKKIEYKKSEKFEAEIQTKFEGNDIWLGIVKI